MPQVYQSAATWAKASPKDPYAHFALSFVLRHGGMLQEAANECEAGSKIDPSNVTSRSCALVYILLGQYERVPPYLEQDPLSMYVRFRRVELAILANDRKTALDVVRTIRIGQNDYPDAHLLEAVLSGAPPETVREWSGKAEALFDMIDHPEGHFVDARYQSWAGQTEPALRLLRRAILNNYCSYPAMDSDPFLANLRRTPEYVELRRAGKACFDNFRSLVAVHGTESHPSSRSPLQ